MTTLDSKSPTEPSVTSGNVQRPWYTSYSGLQKHRECPQAWNYRYLQKIRRAVDEPTIELDMGSWWQALRGFDSIRRGAALGTLRFAPDKLQTADGWHDLAVKDTLMLGDGVSPVIRHAEQWWGKLGEEYQTLWLDKLGAPVHDRLAYMDQTWSREWADEIAAEAPLAVELSFKISLPGRTDKLIGFIDEVYLDKARGDFAVVRDNKTGKALDPDESLDDMMDSQLHLYAWGVVEQVRDWGFRVGAVAYDRSRTVHPKTPQLTASGALSKQVTDYDLNTYQRWAMGPGGDTGDIDGVPWGEPDAYYASGPRKGQPKFGLYTEDPAVVEKLSTPVARAVWHQRRLIPLNRNVIRSHVTAAVDTAAAIDVTVQRVQVSNEAARNFNRKPCSWCDYASLCRAQMLGGPDGEYELSQHGLRR